MLTDQQRLQQLLDKADWAPADREWLLSYLENATPTELKTLMELRYARDLAAADPLEENISALMRRHITARTGVDMTSRSVADLDGTAQSPGDRPVLKKGNRSAYRKLHWWAAAAVFILLAGGAWLYRTGIPASSAAAHRPDSSKDVAPGGNRALLTLSDGRTISLDSAAAGQGRPGDNIKVIKPDSGLLAYRTATSDKLLAASEATYNTITTPRGGQYQVLLSDGTKVWLNAASSLKFPTVFAGKERVVELTGEAYFEVTSRYYPTGAGSPKRARGKIPFIVHVPPTAGSARAEPLDIEVLGTHFNVNAYKDEPAARATLLEGSIRIRRGANTNMLQPGQQAVADNGSSRIRVSDAADLDEAIAWKNGMFVFNSLPLEAIMRQMERWYDVEVSYEGNAGNTSFNGQISRYSNASKMLDMLQTTGEVHFTIENKKIIVRP